MPSDKTTAWAVANVIWATEKNARPARSPLRIAFAGPSQLWRGTVSWNTRSSRTFCSEEACGERWVVGAGANAGCVRQTHVSLRVNARRHAGSPSVSAHRLRPTDRRACTAFASHHRVAFRQPVAILWLTQMREAAFFSRGFPEPNLTEHLRAIYCTKAQ